MDSKGRNAPGRFCMDGSLVVLFVLGPVVALLEDEEEEEEGGRQKSSKRSAWWPECMWMYVWEESRDMVLDGVDVVVDLGEALKWDVFLWAEVLYVRTSARVLSCSLDGSQI